MGRGLAVLIGIVLAVGCVRDPTVRCGELACPAGSVCTANGCAMPDQLAACMGLADAASCTTHMIGNGACVGGVCEPIVCGDGQIVGPEVCDDGNLAAGDGCSVDCRSTEVCGNAIVDGAVDEQCDNTVAGLSRDGCTSRCTIELDSYFDVSPRLPLADSNAAMVYDARRGVVIMFGDDGMWEWNGQTWRHIVPPTSPTPRHFHAMAYDPDRDRVMLYGGQDSITGRVNDTWEWDGITWTQRLPATVPLLSFVQQLAYDAVHHQLVLDAAARTYTWDGDNWTLRGPSPSQDATMAWDAQGARVILFAYTLGSTWAWDGSAWSALTPAASPTPRNYAAMTENNGHIVLYGGLASGNGLTDTWQWANNTWTSLAPAINPGPHYAHAMAYDSARDRVVLFGGNITTTTKTNDIWEWQPNTWAQITPALAPVMRIEAAATYEPLRGQTVLFGGIGAGDTWEWDGAIWARRTPTTSPSPRHRTTLAATRDRVVLFGGLDNTANAPIADMWEWDGTTWTPRSSVHSPTARGGHGLAYDSARDRVVLFGGNVAGGESNETWEWDGTDWMQRSPAHVPPARTIMSLVYDPVRGKTVLFGGASNVPLGDTWEWDGTDWTEITPAIVPPSRVGAGAAFDGARSAMTVFGGSNVNPLDDTWVWDGTTWTYANALISPGPRAYHVFAYDAARAELVMFAGTTWVHRYVSPIYPPDQCEGVDTDGDGLTGCADPDCWGRCTPLCPPRAPCDPSGPRCGDGTCSMLEEHLLCPIDCP
jgi:cysteine-rich repeat protein